MANASGAIALVLFSLLAMSCNGRKLQLRERTDSSSVGRIQYEEGYNVQTVLDGNKLNVTVYSIIVVPPGDYAYALDSTTSKLLKIQLPFGESSEITEVVGGHIGYADGLGSEAMMNHPKGFTIDSYGNIYVADVKNGVIRKVTPQGYVSTIAGEHNKTGSVDGDGSIARFSADFDVQYVPSSCSLLVSDRGNRKLRSIELQSSKDCNKKKVFSYGFMWTLVDVLYSIGMTVAMTGFGLLFCRRRGQGRETVPTSLPDMIHFSESTNEEQCRQLLPDIDLLREPSGSLSLTATERTAGFGAADVVLLIPSGSSSEAAPDTRETALTTQEESFFSELDSIEDGSVDIVDQEVPSASTPDARARNSSLDMEIEKNLRQLTW